MSKKNDITNLDFLEDIGNSDTIALTIPVFEENNESISSLPENLSILPLRNTVLFPGSVMPLTIGREKSINLINDINNSIKIFGAVSQKNASIEEPKQKDLNKIGTVAEIIQVIRHSNKTISVIIRGKSKFELKKITQTEPYFNAEVNYIPENSKKFENEKTFIALANSVKEVAINIIKLNHNLPIEITSTIKNINNNVFLINFLCSNLDINHTDKQRLLECKDVYQRALSLLDILNEQQQMLLIQNDIQRKTRKDIDKQQRDYYLQQQMKTIQDELGNTSDSELNKMKERAAKKNWEDKVKQHFDKELAKLSQLNVNSADFSVQLNYLNTLLDLPWNDCSVDNIDINHAKQILDEDHYGLKKVKERILEYLSVIKLKGNLKSPIICLYGPPGTGKTSLGKSIARALNRQYLRMSLGGLHDESEIRGHRKTYIGAMPGRIIQNIKKAKTSNPVFVLDEIDKVGNDFRGDPASALLEVLDPEQNYEFHDNYLEVDYDLSKVMFIATANVINTINPALLDRMELIDVSGYILEEKLEIAKRHLIRKEFENAGIDSSKIIFEDKAIEKIIASYTRESGVRTLNKKIATIGRKLAMLVAEDKELPKKITANDIPNYLGVEKYFSDQYENADMPGIVTGLAWTAVGGEILFIETCTAKGKGQLCLTGNLGDVMKESATIALEYIKANSHYLDLSPEIFDDKDIFLHVPEGAIPKDGPSAGITMATAIASALTGRKVKEKIAMTGEISLRGKVLPVGGIKEKILAAKRAGIETIVLSKENKRDISEISDEYLDNLNFVYVDYINEVWNHTLMN